MSLNGKKILRFSIAASFVFQVGTHSIANAQVDAGALQRGLEQQLPLPSPLALPEPTMKEGGSPSQAKPGDVRFTVSSFVLEGVKVLPEAEIQNVLKPWIGKEIGFDDLQKACDEIQAYYRKKGYTVQAILPPQKIAGGVVKILITEAKLGKVVVENPQGPTRFSNERAIQYITYANPIGDPLSMPAIERAVIILNETPGVIVSSQLEPGANHGEADLRLKLTQPSLLQGKVEANNYGSRTTGANQGVFSLNLNNPIGIGESFSLNGIASQGSQYIQGAISAPVSPDGLRLGLAGTFLNYKNVSNYTYNGGAGDAWTTGVSAAYPLIRSQGANLNGSLNYDVKSYNNTNFNTNTVVSAYNINNLSASLSGNMVDGLGYGAISSGSVGVIFGHLDTMATSPSTYGMYAIPNTSPTTYGVVTPSNFLKMSFAANRTQQLVADGSTSLYAAVTGQFASVNLNSAEQIYLGGPYGVRAYPVAQSGGAQGGVFNLELKHQLQARLTVSTFFDAGVVQQYKNTYPGWQGQTNANNTYSLMGAGFGLKWDYQGWGIAGMVAWKLGQNPLYSSTGQPVNTDGTTTQPRGWISASYSFQ